MTLHELESPEQVKQFRTSHRNALVCFSATWCGPCRSSKPALMDLARSYEADVGGGGGGERHATQHDLVVGIVYEHTLGDALHRSYGVRAFPTYVLWIKSGTVEAGRVEGANLDGVRRLIESAEGGCRMELGEGHCLGGKGRGAGADADADAGRRHDHKLSAEEERAKRLERLAGMGAGEAAQAAAAAAAPRPKAEDGKDAKPAAAADGSDATPMDVAHDDDHDDKKASVAEAAADGDADMKDADVEIADVTPGSGGAAAAAAEAVARGKDDDNDNDNDDDNENDNENENENDGETKDEMMDPTSSLNEADVRTLTGSMGFALVRAQKGLLNGEGGTVEGAVDWIMAHQDDDDIDDLIPLVPKTDDVNKGQGEGEGAANAAAATAQSYKCNECGKILSNMANLELHANKTGHSDFEESTDRVKPLTAEEKARKIEEIKSLLKSKRTEREEAEKAEDVTREKTRRFMGKEMAKTREEMERLSRMREAKQRRKEKEAFKRERERIRAELEKDKAERRSHKGKLPSKLGAEGYNPDAIQYDAPVVDASASVAMETESTSPAKVIGDKNDKSDPGDTTRTKTKKRSGNPSKIDECISKISSYRAGGDGKNCLKVLLAYVSNIVDKPDEVKYRTIKTDNKVYKIKVKPFLGSKGLLTEAGFDKSDDGEKLVLSDDADLDFLNLVKEKLEEAFQKY